MASHIEVARHLCAYIGVGVTDTCTPSGLGRCRRHMYAFKGDPEQQGNGVEASVLAHYLCPVPVPNILAQCPCPLSVPEA